MGLRAWVDMDTANTAPEQAWRVNGMSRIRIIPFPPYHTADEAEIEVFSDLNNHPEMPNHQTVQEGVTYELHCVIDREISQTELNALQAGDMAVFLGGIIRYKDQKGCTYKTEFCGYWKGGGANEMNMCPGGHNAEAIRTGDECTPEP